MSTGLGLLRLLLLDLILILRLGVIRSGSRITRAGARRRARTFVALLAASVVARAGAAAIVIRRGRLFLVRRHAVGSLSGIGTVRPFARAGVAAERAALFVRVEAIHVTRVGSCGRAL